MLNPNLAAFSHEMFEIPAPDTYQGQLMQTARLSALADKYDVGALQVNICEDLFDLAADCEIEVPSFAVLKFVYANTGRNAIIRQVIAEWFAWTEIRRRQSLGDGMDEVSTDWLYDIPEFGIDLALALYNPACGTETLTPFEEGNKSQYMQKFTEEEEEEDD